MENTYIIYIMLLALHYHRKLIKCADVLAKVLLIFIE